MLVLVIGAILFFPFTTSSPLSLSAEVQKVEFSFLNKSLMIAHLEIRSVNKTHKALFGNSTFLVPAIKDISYIDAKLYRLVRKEYVGMPKGYKMIASDALDKYNTFEVQDILKKHFSPPFGWPIKVGVVYHIFDILTMYNNLPPIVPAGDYKTALGYFLDEKRKMGQLNVYVKAW